MALALAACSSMEASRYPSPVDYPVHGIDVSKYQGRIDWQAAAAGGVRFAYIKATEGGDSDDTMFTVNWNGARAAGIPTGAYHFYYFCRPVEDQIEWFKKHVPPTRSALPPVLDIEWNPQSRTCKVRPPRAKIISDMHRFLRAMEAFYGKRPIIYTTVDFHRDVLPGELSDYPFWLRSVAGYPSTKYGNRRWSFWQYTATGRVPGIRANVDRNVFAGSEKDWDRFLALNSRTGTDIADNAAPAMKPAAPAAAPDPVTAVASNDDAPPPAFDEASAGPAAPASFASPMEDGTSLPPAALPQPALAPAAPLRPPASARAPVTVTSPVFANAASIPQPPQDSRRLSSPMDGFTPLPPPSPRTGVIY